MTAINVAVEKYHKLIILLLAGVILFFLSELLYVDLIGGAVHLYSLPSKGWKCLFSEAL